MEHVDSADKIYHELETTAFEFETETQNRAVNNIIEKNVVVTGTDSQINVTLKDLVDGIIHNFEDQVNTDPQQTLQDYPQNADIYHTDPLPGQNGKINNNSEDSINAEKLKKLNNNLPTCQDVANFLNGLESVDLVEGTPTLNRGNGPVRGIVDEIIDCLENGTEVLFSGDKDTQEITSGYSSGGSNLTSDNNGSQSNLSVSSPGFLSSPSSEELQNFTSEVLGNTEAGFSKENNLDLVSSISSPSDLYNEHLSLLSIVSSQGPVGFATNYLSAPIWVSSSEQEKDQGEGDHPPAFLSSPYTPSLALELQSNFSSPITSLSSESPTYQSFNDFEKSADINTANSKIVYDDKDFNVKNSKTDKKRKIRSAQKTDKKKKTRSTQKTDKEKKVRSTQKTDKEKKVRSTQKTNKEKKVRSTQEENGIPVKRKRGRPRKIKVDSKMDPETAKSIKLDGSNEPDRHFVNESEEVPLGMEKNRDTEVEENFNEYGGAMSVPNVNIVGENVMAEVELGGGGQTMAEVETGGQTIAEVETGGETWSRTDDDGFLCPVTGLFKVMPGEAVKDINGLEELPTGSEKSRDKEVEENNNQNAKIAPEDIMEDTEADIQTGYLCPESGLFIPMPDEPQDDDPGLVTKDEIVLAVSDISSGTEAEENNSEYQNKSATSLSKSNIVAGAAIAETVAADQTSLGMDESGFLCPESGLFKAMPDKALDEDSDEAAKDIYELEEAPTGSERSRGTEADENNYEYLDEGTKSLFNENKITENTMEKTETRGQTRSEAATMSNANIVAESKMEETEAKGQICGSGYLCPESGLFAPILDEPSDKVPKDIDDQQVSVTDVHLDIIAEFDRLRRDSVVYETEGTEEASFKVQSVFRHPDNKVGKDPTGSMTSCEGVNQSEKENLKHFDEDVVEKENDQFDEDVFEKENEHFDEDIEKENLTKGNEDEESEGNEAVDQDTWNMSVETMQYEEDEDIIYQDKDDQTTGGLVISNVFSQQDAMQFQEMCQVKDSYFCEKCKHTCKSAEEFGQHVCPEAQVPDDQKSQLVDMMTLELTKKSSHQCVYKVCGKKFATDDEVERHLVADHHWKEMSKIDKCPDKGEAYPNKADANPVTSSGSSTGGDKKDARDGAHSTTHVGLDVTVECPIKCCVEKFHSMAEVNEHKAKAHKEVTCRYCSQVFTSFRMHAAHEATHHPSLVNIAFDPDTNMYKTGPIETMKCLVCDLLQDSEQTLRHHTYVYHKQVPLSSYHCSWCNRAYNCKADAEHHAVNVLNLLINSCDECSLWFHSIQEVEEHLKNSHNSKEILCQECNLWFIHSSVYDLHRAILHNEKTIAIEEHKGSKREQQDQAVLDATVQDDNTSLESMIAGSDKAVTAGVSQQDDKLGNSDANSEMSSLYGTADQQQCSTGVNAEVSNNEKARSPQVVTSSTTETINSNVEVIVISDDSSDEGSSHSDSGKSVQSIAHSDGGKSVQSINEVFSHSISGSNDGMDLNEIRIKTEPVEPVEPIQQQQHVCIFCQAVFMTHLGLIQHARITHIEQDQNNKVCLVCEKKYSSEEHLKDHECVHTVEAITDALSKIAGKMKKQDGESQLRCAKCKQVFATNEELKRHSCRSDATNATYSCKICKLRCVDEKALKTHYSTTSHKFKAKKQIAQRREKYSQQTKKAVTSVSSKLQAKYVKKHRRDNVLHCKLCFKTFQDDRTLLKHIKCWHRISKVVNVLQKNPDRSNVVRKQQENKTSTDDSIIVLDSDDEEVEMAHGYTCPLNDCTEVYNSSKEVAAHMLSHDEDASYSCQLELNDKKCGKGFFSLSSLLKHVESMHYTGFLNIFLKSYSESCHRCQVNNCSMSFESEEKLLMHMRDYKHPSDQRFVCPHCSIPSLTFVEHVLHICRKHASQWVPRTKKPKVVKKLEEVLGKNTPIYKWLFCHHNACWKFFNGHYNVALHMIEHTENENGLFTCLLGKCSAVMKKTSTLFKHIRDAHHPDFLTDFVTTYRLSTSTCHYSGCNQNFCQQDELVNHMWQRHGHYGNNSASLVCPHCSQLSLNLTTHASHIILTHNKQWFDRTKLKAIKVLIHELTSKFLCDYKDCVQMFDNRRSLQLHILEHFPWRCHNVLCALARYATRDQLLVHCKEQPDCRYTDRQKCHYVQCNQTFDAIHDLVNHEMTDHMLPPMLSAMMGGFNKQEVAEINVSESQIGRSHECPGCNGKFVDVKKYLHHRVTHHEWMQDLVRMSDVSGEYMPLKRQMYKCQYCRREFTCAEDVSLHEMSHKDHWSPFKCRWCSRTFYSKPSLAIHVAVILKTFHGILRRNKLSSGLSFKYVDASLTRQRLTCEVKCDVCSVWFNTQQGLEKHLAHGLEVHRPQETTTSTRHVSETPMQTDPPITLQNVASVSRRLDPQITSQKVPSKPRKSSRSNQTQVTRSCEISPPQLTPPSQLTPLSVIMESPDSGSVLNQAGQDSEVSSGLVQVEKASKRGRQAAEADKEDCVNISSSSNTIGDSDQGDNVSVTNTDLGTVSVSSSEQEDVGPLTEDEPMYTDTQGMDIMCQVCFEHFDETRQLTKHMKNIHNVFDFTPRKKTTKKNASKNTDECTNKPNKCPDCAMTFRYPSELKRHLASNCCKKYRCRVCSAYFRLPSLLKRHKCKPVKNASGDGDIEVVEPFKCFPCRMTFSKGQKGRVAWLNHFHGDKPNEPAQCSSCLTCFTNGNELQNHKLHVHAKYAVQCQECKQWFGTKKQCREHAKQHNKVNCEFCGMTCMNRRKLKQHMAKKHPKIECCVCKSNFANRTILEQHVRKEHTGDTQVECAKCNKKFANQRQLTMHDKVCEKNALKSTDAQESTEEAQESTDAPKSTSDTSDASTAQVVLLKCAHCSLKFSKRSFLKMHEKNHEKNHDRILRFSCNICDMTFTKPDFLKRHKQRLHHNQSVFIHRCHLCKMMFSKDEFLTRHLQNKHYQNWSETGSSSESSLISQSKGKDTEKLSSSSKPGRDTDKVMTAKRNLFTDNSEESLKSGPCTSKVSPESCKTVPSTPPKLSPDIQNRTLPTVRLVKQTLKPTSLADSTVTDIIEISSSSSDESTNDKVSDPVKHVMPITESSPKSTEQTTKKSKRWRCGYCSRVFDDSNSMLMHQVKHADVRIQLKLLCDLKLSYDTTEHFYTVYD